MKLQDLIDSWPNICDLRHPPLKKKKKLDCAKAHLKPSIYK